MGKAAPPPEKEKAPPKGQTALKVAPAPLPAGSPLEPRRSYVTLPLAQLVPAITRPVFKKRSPAGATLMVEWAAIVGSQLATVTEPRRLARGVLTIACAGPVAMELQHLQAMLIERINTHAGSPIVDKLRFLQDHVTPRALPAVPTPPGTPEKLADMPEGPLADALSLLRQAIRTRVHVET